MMMSAVPTWDYTSRTYGPTDSVQVLPDTRYFRGALARTSERNAVRGARCSDGGHPGIHAGRRPGLACGGFGNPQTCAHHLIIQSLPTVMAGGRSTMPMNDSVSMTRLPSPALKAWYGRPAIGSAISVREDVIDYPLYEITSSALNMSYRDENNEPGPNRIGDMYAPANFGAISVDWNNRSLSLEIRDDAGQTVRQQRVELDDLTRN